jgi:hypothetical protein
MPLTYLTLAIDFPSRGMATDGGAGTGPPGESAGRASLFTRAMSGVHRFQRLKALGKL